MRKLFLLAIFASAAQAETYTLTLKQALERALSQSPEAMIARLDQMKAAAGVRIAQDPFTPHVGAGSGLAYSSGFPLSIEGSAPAVIQAKVTQAIYNRPQSIMVSQAKENARGATIAAGEKSDEIAFRVASLFLDAQRAGQLAEAARRQVESLVKVSASVAARVEGGRELPVANSEANVNRLRARQRVVGLEADRDYSERSLAAALGYAATDSVRPAEGEREVVAIPDTEQAAMAAALAGSKELRRLESSYQASSLEMKANRAQRLPKVDLVAQYALLAKYSHYDEYFNKFQRHNWQLGASIQIPILAGGGVDASISQAQIEQQRIRAEMQQARSKITLAVHQSYQEIEKAQLGADLAKAELDLAHEQLSILLVQLNEGRVTLRQVEEARFAEDEKWITFYDAQFSTERARLNVLRQTGELVARLR
ncbi:MAG: outer rane efflux protein [Bryobacterales bacterium]|jgi:outer membrane protein|nr:outer rane efflux protein [Bryobacterales bacterium]